MLSIVVHCPDGKKYPLGLTFNDTRVRKLHCIKEKYLQMSMLEQGQQDFFPQYIQITCRHLFCMYCEGMPLKHEGHNSDHEIFQQDVIFEI